jgi:hypothetical protein
MIVNNAELLSSRGRLEFGFDTPELQPSGMIAVALGEQADGPVVLFLVSPPNLKWAAHSHNTDTVTSVVEGSVRVGRKWYGPGSVRVQECGSVYGPGITGSDGAKTVVCYANRQGLPDQFVRGRDQLEFSDLPERSRVLLASLQAMF